MADHGREPDNDRLDDEERNSLWARHHAEWRDTAQVASQWQEANETDPKLLGFSVRGSWWDLLSEGGVTLLITREYEHLVMAIAVVKSEPSISYMRLPHPSGLVADRDRGIVHIASTRNPNQVYDLAPIGGLLSRMDVKLDPLEDRPLVPICSQFFPGCLYIHDLAIIGGDLYANAVGQNAVIRIDNRGSYEQVWWPRCIESDSGPIFGQNHIQLNSIGAGENLKSSYFSASSDKVSARRPGHLNFPVDRRGVIFSGATREPIARGLTRPHSARVGNGRVWVDNSGYGEFVVIDGGNPVVVTRLPGWTRGLCLREGIAFVGTSRVIPRFRQYAPGLDVEKSECGVHAIDLQTGNVLGSIMWPTGNQIFAIDWLPSNLATGFPFTRNGRQSNRQKHLFYSMQCQVSDALATSV